MLKYLLIAAITLSTASVSYANLVVTLLEVDGDGVEFIWSGSGTLTSTGAGAPLDFSDFGTFLDAGLASGSYTLANPISLLTGNLLTGPVNFQVFNGISLNNDVADDLTLTGTGSTISVGQSYVANGRSIVETLDFSDLVPGTYSSSTDDAGMFGGVTLRIAAIPEPSAFLFGSLIAGVAGITFGRRRLAHKA